MDTATLILHPYGDTRKDDQKQTWDFLAQVRVLAKVRSLVPEHKLEVIDRNVTGKWGYVDFVKEYWGTDDIIILEDDKVPTMRDLRELIDCPEPFCCFPHSVNFQFITTMRQWRKFHPYTTGFVKFSKEAQLRLPPDKWAPFIFSYKEERPSVDKAIEEPLTEIYGPMHLHERMVKHNHGRDPVSKLKGLKYQVLLILNPPRPSK